MTDGKQARRRNHRRPDVLRARGNLYLVDLRRSVSAHAQHDVGGFGDTLNGQGGNDIIHAGAGNDIVAGGSGDDTIYGGAGNNIATYSGPSTTYAVALQAGASAAAVRDRSGADGTDTLVDVQQLQFTDRTVDISTAAKAATLSPSQFAGLIEIYIASFDRAPDALGLDFWGARLKDGMPLQDIAKSFFTQPEVATFYPAGQTTQAFVTAVYNNVLNRGPDAAGLAYWVGQLQSGQSSKDSFLLDVISGATAFAGSDDARTLANKLAVGGHFALTQGLSDVAWSKTVMAGVSAAASSVAIANQATDTFAAMAATGSTSELVVQIVGITA